MTAAAAAALSPGDASDEVLAPELLRVHRRELAQLEEQVRLHLTPEVRDTRLKLQELEQTVNDRFDRLERLLDQAINR